MTDPQAKLPASCIDYAYTFNTFVSIFTLHLIFQIIECMDGCHHLAPCFYPFTTTNLVQPPTLIVYVSLFVCQP
jgi:hypothetical protein